MTSFNEARADLRILGMANEKRKFAIAVSYPMDDEMVLAFERGIDNDWYQLVDVSPISLAPKVICRIFKVTDAGMARMVEAKNTRPENVAAGT